MTRVLAVIVVVATVASARAQPAPPAPAPEPTPVPQPSEEPQAPTSPAPDEAPRVETSSCARRTQPAARPGEIKIKDVSIGVRWKEFEITGDFVDPPKVVRQLLEPTMERNHVLTEDGRREIVETAARFGYHVVGLGTRDTAEGVIAHLHLSPRPMVRRVDVKVDQSLREPLFKDEVKRRLRVRPGVYLPWAPDERACELLLEKERIESFFQEEGYFDAEVTIDQTTDDGVGLDVYVDLKDEYTVDVDDIKIRIIEPEDQPKGSLPIKEDQIRDAFRHKRGSCLLVVWVCLGSLRFTQAQHQQDVQKVVEMFHKAGYPAVRVTSDFDLATASTSLDRVNHKVVFEITIDPRRKIDVRFEGNHTAAHETLLKQLTFNEARNADPVEAQESARAITRYLQSRGYFDARVTWDIDSLTEDVRSIIFRIDQGRRRRVRRVEFVGNRQAFARADDLRKIVGTQQIQLSTTLLGATTYPTSETLAADVSRIHTLYHRNGYRDARVGVTASTDPRTLGSAALTAAVLGADLGDDLYVRFTIDEGRPTTIGEVHVDLGDEGDDAITTPEQRMLCKQLLADLASLYAYPKLAIVPEDRCRAMVPSSAPLLFREEAAKSTQDRLKDRLFARGRPRADVTLEPILIAPHLISARYKLKNTQRLEVGKLVVRGNFRTRDSIIRGQLKLVEGQLLTTEALGESIRRLRSTGLFNSVSIDLPELDTTTEGSVNAVVKVTERYDHRAQIDLETGYSSFNGTFIKVLPSMKNLFGVGVALDLNGTIGFNLGELIDTGNVTLRQLSAEATLRFPQFLPPRVGIPLEFSTELTGFHRRQDTPRFGILRTTGGTLAFSKSIDRQRTATHAARAITFGLHYDFRSRERNVDVLRPIGADDDDSQVPITTRTSSVGFSAEWEQRVDRTGNLSPLAPEAGFRLESQVSVAEPYILGQDAFIKVSGAASKFTSIGPNLVLRADARYDHGIPLGGAALLPEVERFFGGGDSTVRGYNDDRLATEIVQVGVPPLANVSQIRILPAGGNIRALASIDAQLRIYKLFSTALFADAGVITNQWSTVDAEDIRPSVGMALMRIVTPFGAFAWERAVPLRPRLGDDPRGRWHISFAARAQF